MPPGTAVRASVAVDGGRQKVESGEWRAETEEEQVTPTLPVSFD